MKNKLLLIPMFLVLFSSLALADITGDETMTRTGPASVEAGSSFAITYTVIGATAPWGTSIVDAVSGGCTFPAGTDYRTVMLSDEGNTRTATITAPATAGICTFTGDYKFGSFPEIVFSTLSVTITGEVPANGDDDTTPPPATEDVCTSIPTKPCDTAIWHDYPTCAWDESPCYGDDDGLMSMFGTNINWLYVICGGLLVVLLIKILDKNKK